eukprot:3688961-Pyramimonas_sp.AAC.1
MLRRSRVAPTFLSAHFWAAAGWATCPSLFGCWVVAHAAAPRLRRGACAAGARDIYSARVSAPAGGSNSGLRRALVREHVRFRPLPPF